MRVTSKLARTERKRQVRSICCPAKPGNFCRMTPVHGLIRPNRRPRTAVAAIRRAERLTRRHREATFTSTGRPLGECRRDCSRRDPCHFRPLADYLAPSGEGRVLGFPLIPHNKDRARRSANDPRRSRAEKIILQTRAVRANNYQIAGHVAREFRNRHARLA